MDRKFFIPSVIFAFFFLTSCVDKPARSGKADTKIEADSPTVIIQAKDSTLYGKAGDCGMSTFCLICDNGDTLYVDRSSEAGVDGVIYGDLILDDRFCMIISNDKQSLVSAINLSQLNTFVKDYKILNGRLILQGPDLERGDTVQIMKLSSKECIVKDIHGERSIPKVQN